MLKKWLIISGLGLLVGVLAVSTRQVSQAVAVPSDNNEDVKKNQEPSTKEEPPDLPKAKIDSVTRARQWREKLNQTVTIEFEPNTPLREALSHVADRYKMTIYIDTETFKAEQSQPDIENQPVRLWRLVDVKLLTALRAIFQQINGDFYIKDNMLTVVPRTYIETGRVLKHPVDVSFNKRPLAEALTELSEISGLSVVLDPRGQADSSFAVTADFRNVPVQDAVRVLANMAGMKSVVMDNLLYVTSTSNAEQLRKEKEREREALPVRPYN
jgi:type II secretory pathway component GspD/PulD (secretin)